MTIPKKATLGEISRKLKGIKTLLDAHARSQGFTDWLDMVAARNNEGKYA